MRHLYPITECERKNQRVLFTRETEVDQYHVDNYVKGTLELETSAPSIY